MAYDGPHSTTPPKEKESKYMGDRAETMVNSMVSGARWANMRVTECFRGFMVVVGCCIATLGFSVRMLTIYGVCACVRACACPSNNRNTSLTDVQIIFLFFSPYITIFLIFQMHTCVSNSDTNVSLFFVGLLIGLQSTIS